MASQRSVFMQSRILPQNMPFLTEKSSLEPEPIFHPIATPMNPFIDDLIHKIDVNNCDGPLRKKIMTNVLKDRFGGQIQRIINAKLEGKDIKCKE